MEYFDFTREEIENKLFNIFVGISLGNKLITPKLAKKYVKWAHEHTKDNAVILIADDIDTINWTVFRGMTQKEAEEKVGHKGYGVKGLFDSAARNLSREENDPTYISNVHFLFWSDIKNKGFDDLKKVLAKEYKTNESFREQVLYFVDKYIELRDVEVSSDDKDKLADYIISELPTLLGGIRWNDTLYNLVLYPTYADSGMSKFVLDIRGGKYFDASKLHLRQICVLVEDYLQEPVDKELIKDY